MHDYWLYKFQKAIKQFSFQVILVFMSKCMKCVQDREKKKYSYAEFMQQVGNFAYQCTGHFLQELCALFIDTKRK